MKNETPANEHGQSSRIGGMSLTLILSFDIGKR